MRMQTFTPKDRTKREHLGSLERVVHADGEGQFCILKLTDGASVLLSADADQFVSGQQYLFLGRWQDGRYGPEFKAGSFTRGQPFSRAAVVRYLSETCRNIGHATAVKLWDKYGPDAVRTVREESHLPVEAGILSGDAAMEASDDLQQFAHVERTKVELFGLFAGRGFPGKIIDRCIGKWGVAAPAVVRQSPFRLLTNKLPGAGFKRCDKMFLELGGRPSAMKRQAIAAWSAMKEDRTGSTWCDANDIVTAVKAAIPNADPVKALRILIRAGWARVRRDGSARYVTTRERADAEQRIADSVRRLSRFPSLWPTDILTSVAEGDGLPSEHQAGQAKLATAGAVGFFIGGPGTGKTHTLAFLLKQALTILGESSAAVAAPTGKASVRAGESLRARGLAIMSSTIHQLLEIGRNGHDGDGWGFVRNLDNPLDVRLLVIDESSMLDATLMAETLEALPDGANVLFVGDPYQLPPVGHGAPLRDLLAAGLPQGELVEVRRNAGGIVRACAAIKAGTPVVFSDRIDLEAADQKNIRLIECGQVETAGVIEDVITSLKRFNPVWETQIITALNDKSDTSRKKLNERFGKLLNPDGKAARGNPFRVGDKIICTRNTRLKTVEPVGKLGRPGMDDDAGYYIDRPFKYAGCLTPEWYVANGEIGRVVAVGEKHTIARFGGVDVPLVKITVGKAQKSEDDADGGGTQLATSGGGSADFDPAWAITVHRSQGSEWPCVICVIDDAASMIADRNFWYTAISRARSMCLVIGPRGVFDRQRVRQALTRRRTFLPELLRE